MSDWYCRRSEVRDVLGSDSRARDAAIDIAIAGGSRQIDERLGIPEGYFYPHTATRYYRWPQRTESRVQHRRSQVLYLDAWLISLTSMTGESGDNTIPTSEIFLEPANDGPPYTRLEIDYSTTNVNAEFAGGADQRDIAVTGSWGYRASTVGASSLGAAIATAAATSMTVKDGSLIDVGDALLIETEQLFISARTDVDLAQNLNGALTASVTDTTVVIDGAPADAVNVGEVLRVGSERMRVTAINSTTSFEVSRGYAGTTLAAHLSSADVFIERVYTIERGVNGTTAATHADDTAISRYTVPDVIRQLAVALAANGVQQGLSAYSGDAGGEARMRQNPVGDLWMQVMAGYGAPIAAGIGAYEIAGSSASENFRV